MLYGNGIDLTYIPEFSEVLGDKKSHFVSKYFTTGEIEYIHSHGPERSAGHLAARYAAKEAFIKALDGPRLHQEAALKIDYQDIEVKNDSHGRPFLACHGALREYVNTIGITRTHLSISHIGEYAIAQVILET